MWIEVEINAKKYFLLCKNDDKDNIDCVLYDGKESWHENETFTIILKRSKEFNKRIQFDEATVRDTLENGKPVELNWIEKDSTDMDANSRSLKLKYKVQNCPLNFVWHLTKQTEHEFQQFILFPLFRIVQGLTQQNNELREAIRKKDMEIAQFKTEGAVLKRTTVATRPFNFTNFDKRYAETITLSKTIMQISDLLKEQYSPIRSPIISKKNGTENNQKICEQEEKLTPRRKRRKMLEEQQRLIAENIKARAKSLEYESSQSQSLSLSSSENETKSTHKKSIEAGNDTKSAHKKSDDVDITKPKESEHNEESKSTPVSGHKKSFSPQKRKSVVNIEYEESDKSSEEEKIPKRSPLKKFKNSKHTEESNNIEKLADTSTTSLRTLRSNVSCKLSSPGKSKNTFTIQYEDSQSPPNKGKLEKTETPPPSPIKQKLSTEQAKGEQSATDKICSDVQKLLDELKALEQRRIADLNKRESK